jgi:hypothetical protein
MYSFFVKYLYVIMRFPVRKIFFVLCLVSFALTACSSFNNEDTKEIGSLPEVSCVAVLPTAVPTVYSDSLTAAGKKNMADGAAYIDSVMAAELGDRSEFKLLTENQLDAILGDPWGGRLQQVRDIGQATRCGAVLRTSLSRYRERVGSEMSAETPAAAAFSMELIGVEGGVVLWTASFDETQKALFEDIFSFEKAQKRGFKWLSVQELSRDGVKSRLQEFPFFQKGDSE